MPKKPALHKQVFVGMVAGIAGGIGLQMSGLPAETIESVVKVVKPVGDIFLRMIFMMVIPLVLSALALGVAQLGDLRRIGKVGIRTLVYTVLVSIVSVVIGITMVTLLIRTLVYTVLVSIVSVVIGITMVTLFEPGRSINESDRQFLVERFAGSAAQLQGTVADVKARGLGDIITVLVPRNPFEDMVRAFDPTYTGGGLLAVMFFALMIGVALSVAKEETVRTFKQFLEGLYEIVMKVIGFGMKLAPIGVASLLFSLTATMGLSILTLLSKFVLVVLAALAIHQFVTYSFLVKFLGKMDPVQFFRAIREVMMIAFSTSSSNATLPTAIRVTIDNLKLPRDITNFVLTLGSTANQNGTALYEGITVLFLAQCFGIHLELSQQIFVVVLAILGGIGTAGVPSGSLPIIMLILISIGVPGESIGIIYGVDRLLDMCRTVLNVTGDITAAVYVSRFEGQT